MLVSLLFMGCFVAASFSNNLWANETLGFQEGRLVNSTVYNPTRARVFLQFSKVAYCDGVSIADWNCVPCKQLSSDYEAIVVTDSRTQGQAYVSGSATEQSIVVAFRGSSNIPNWISNLNFTKISAYPKCNSCEVHGGFYDAWTALEPGIVAQVKRFKQLLPNARIFVTGHSLGGALAVLAAAELYYTQGWDIEAIYTYGEPRVGNENFAQFYNQGTKISWRVTHNRDPVPHVPPTFFGFTHIATEVFYNEDSSSYKVCDGSGEDPTCSDQFTLTTKLADHLNYLQVSTSCN